MDTTQASPQTDFSHLVERMYGGDRTAGEELIQLLTPGLRTIIGMRVNPEDVEDTLQSTMGDLLVTIRKRHLRDGNALPQFARTIALRQCARRIKTVVKERATFAYMPDENVSLIPTVHPPSDVLCIQEEQRRIVALTLCQL